MSALVHATSVFVPDLGGALIMGESGAGKSALALALIRDGALLISDDQTELRVENGALVARAPKTIKGLIEARGIGIVAVPTIEAAIIVAAFEIGTANPERMPEKRFFETPKTLPKPAKSIALFALPPEAESGAKLLRAGLYSARTGGAAAQSRT